jgi:hypothetical protein
MGVSVSDAARGCGAGCAIAASISVIGGIGASLLACWALPSLPHEASARTDMDKSSERTQAVRMRGMVYPFDMNLFCHGKSTVCTVKVEDNPPPAYAQALYRP